jgi:hypothetical protein
MPLHCIINGHQDLIDNLIYLNSTDTPLVGFRTPFGILYEQSCPTYSGIFRMQRWWPRCKNMLVFYLQFVQLNLYLVSVGQAKVCS